MLCLLDSLLSEFELASSKTHPDLHFTRTITILPHDTGKRSHNNWWNLGIHITLHHRPCILRTDLVTRVGPGTGILWGIFLIISGLQIVSSLSAWATRLVQLTSITRFAFTIFGAYNWLQAFHFRRCHERSPHNFTACCRAPLLQSSYSPAHQTRRYDAACIRKHSSSTYFYAAWTLPSSLDCPWVEGELLF